MKTANIAAMIAAAASLWAASAAVASNDPAATGRLLVIDGGVLIQRNVQTVNADVGSIVGVGDTILTTSVGTAQWQMSDTSVFAMAADSGFKINKYALPSAGNVEGVASYALLKGAVHTITGKIGKGVAGNIPHSVYSAATDRFNPANLIKVGAAPAGPYTLKTTLAVITTKGADFTAVQADKLLKVLVKVGSATVCTVAGCATPVAGDGVVVSCDGCKPTVVAGASLGLDSLVASLEFNLQVPAALERGDQVTDPRTQALSPTQACRTVLAHLEGSANCDHGDGAGQPVSPN